MEYQEVKNYLDALIRVRDEARNIQRFNSSIEAIMAASSDIHIYKGIEIIADVMGLKLDKKKFLDRKPRYFFIYAGVEFFQLGSSDDSDKA